MIIAALDRDSQRAEAPSADRASVKRRVGGKLIDLFLVVFIAAVLPRFFGPLLGFAYSLLADGLPFSGWEGQSVGKRLAGLRVKSLLTGKPALWRESAVRNSPIGVATFFAIIPIWGWIILALIGIPLLGIELYLLLRVQSGHRLGDVMADTEVVTAQRPGWMDEWITILKKRFISSTSHRSSSGRSTE